MADDSKDEKIPPRDRKWERKYAKFVARYWADEMFRDLARKQPETALGQFGLSAPDMKKTAKYRVLELDRETNLFVIPKIKGDDIVSGHDEGGDHCFGTAGTIGTIGCLDGTFGCAGTFGTRACWDTCLELCIGGDDDEPDDEDPEEPDEPDEPETEPSGLR